jgi:hypothetical protein
MALIALAWTEKVAMAGSRYDARRDGIRIAWPGAAP